MNQRLEFFCNRDPISRQLAFYIATRVGNKMLVADPLTLKPVEDGAVRGLATAYFSMEDGQRLMDELWLAGLRPTEGSGSAGSLAATERHLADMRRYADRLLDATLKGAP